MTPTPYYALLVLALVCMGLPRASIRSAETMTTVAGNGRPANTGESGVATEVGVKDPFGVEVGPDGALYVTEVGHHRVRRVAAGQVSTVAGNGRAGYAGDGGLAVEASLNEPYEVRFDSQGNMLLVEMQNHLVRSVDRAGRIRTVAGTGVAGFSGDGGPARLATFRRPHSLVLDSENNLYIADIGNHRIRRVDARTGIVKTVAGTGEAKLPHDGELAEGHPMRGPRALAITGSWLWIALREGHSVWRMSLSTGRLEHIAGSGQKGFHDGDASEATFNGPKGIVVDEAENVLVVDTENHVIRRIDGLTRRVTTVAGCGLAGGSGDGGPARKAKMNRPHGICLGKPGEMFIGDTLNHRVRRVANAP